MTKSEYEGKLYGYYECESSFRLYNEHPFDDNSINLLSVLESFVGKDIKITIEEL